MEKKYIIVYNLSLLEGLDIVLPTAYICDVDSNGRPGYIQASALKDNIVSYGIEIMGTIHESLLQTCAELSPAQLEKEFNKGKKKPQRLSLLFSDSKINKTLLAIIDKRMVKFLNEIKVNNCFLCYQLQRQVKSNEKLLAFFNESAKPKLQFIKTQTGVRYLLKLEIGEEAVVISGKDIRIISNFPAIICIDNMIMPVEAINSAKIKPFLKKESVFVPENIVKTYFSQFVTDVMGLVDIEADGFRISKSNKIEKQSIFFLFDIFEDKWFADIRFDYGWCSFNASDASKRKTKLQFEDNGEIVVYECARIFSSEAYFYDVLKYHGFEQAYNNRFFISGNTYSIFTKLGELKETLSDYFDIEFPQIEGKQIDCSKWNIKPEIRLINDWFDLYGTIEVGSESHPFSSLFSYIRRENRFFKLRSGGYAIIPEEIFTKYSQIAKFVVDEGSKSKLNKSHFMLLEEEGHKPLKKESKNHNENQFAISALLKTQLRPYQEEGVRWLVSHRKNGLGACLADDMGLGKTLQTIAALLDAKENKPHDVCGTRQPVQLDLFGEMQTTGRKSLNALIVLPASLVFNWYRELRMFAPSLQVLQYVGPKRHQVRSTLLTFDVILTTYHTLVSDLTILKPLHFHYIVLDESQQIRNKLSMTFQAVHQLSSDHRVSLSGTPIENSLSDLWAQMEFINPSVLGSFSFFKQTFLLHIEKNKDEKAISDLKKLVDPYILRRTKEQVAHDLPDLIESYHYSEMSDEQATVYEKEKSAARNYLAGLDKGSGNLKIHILSSLMRLRQIANHPYLTDEGFNGKSGKFDDVKGQIDTVVRAGHKVLVFSSFVRHLDIFASWMSEENIAFVTLTGSMGSEERKASVESFQSNSDIKVFLLSIKAGGTGLNLTEADYVFILDPWWNPFAEKQAVARAHRIGRINNVMVKRFISRHTIEEKIIVLQDHKKMLSDNILDINGIPALSDEELIDLI